MASKNDCGRRAFKAGLRFSGRPKDKVPRLDKVSKIAKLAEKYGLQVTDHAVQAPCCTQPVLVVYRWAREPQDAVHHVVFLSDIQPFISHEYIIRLVVYGWEDLTKTKKVV